MILKFKKQAYQEKAVSSVIDCFKGQPNSSSLAYKIDLGIHGSQKNLLPFDNFSGFKNKELLISKIDILRNIQNIQIENHLPISQSLIKNNSPTDINLDIEMETGTGKTYVYIKTIYELNKHYGWNKFIIVVPSVAIREGVFKSFEITANHFLEDYGSKIRYFIYDSSNPQKIDSFSSDAGINVIIINSQVFNSTDKDSRRIYQELDSFQSRAPIEIIKANQPILIIDEPQKLEGDINKPSKTILALREFNPLFSIRYSATHTINYNKVHRLDAIDAFNNKLVKKIAVKGITVKGMGGISAYLELKLIEISKSHPPTASIEFEVKQKNEIKKLIRKVSVGDNLYSLSNELEQYKNYVVSEIDARTDTLAFTNGLLIQSGKPQGDVDDRILRRIQIRETIRSHFEKEMDLYNKNIKVLSLFFIDQVSKYRNYDEDDNKGEYAKIFEEEYKKHLEMIKELNISQEYRSYINSLQIDKIHNGYFSVDKKGKYVDSTSARDTESDDVKVYDLILKDKARLLSFEEPTRFIFSHSALREGWDNPNVFVICTLKNTDNKVTRRQEVGRGLRLSVNQAGERQDNPINVHDINVLTVIANESYQNFVTNLQKEMTETLSERPKIVNADYFINKFLAKDLNTFDNIFINKEQAKQFEHYLIKNEYLDINNHITHKYHNDLRNNNLAEMPESLKDHSAQFFNLVNLSLIANSLPSIENDREIKINKLNKNFDKKEFQELWSRINSKAYYKVKFDESELVKKCIEAINQELIVSPIEYIVEHGSQNDEVDLEIIKTGTSFNKEKSSIAISQLNAHSNISYDLIGKIVNYTMLTRSTISDILSRISDIKFDFFKRNPEDFISRVSRIINEQKSTTIVEHISYNSLDQKYDNDIFTQNFERIVPSDSSIVYQKHVYDYLNADSRIEEDFAKELEISDEVIVYSKIPKGFMIPTPVGNYNPDWAIVFKKGFTKHIYFIAETKGSLSSLELREVETAKIKCAKKYFSELNNKINIDKVKYDVVDNYSSLINLVS